MLLHYFATNQLTRIYQSEMRTMNKTAIEKEIIQGTRKLSNNALREVLDFVQFMRSKEEKDQPFQKSVKRELRSLSDNSLSHLEEKFSNYKEKYPCEQ